MMAVMAVIAVIAVMAVMAVIVVIIVIVVILSQLIRASFSVLQKYGVSAQRCAANVISLWPTAGFKKSCSP